MPPLFPRYVVMGWSWSGGNPVHYGYNLDEAIEIANRWIHTDGKWCNPPYHAEVCISDNYNWLEIDAEAERLGINRFCGIPIYSTLRYHESGKPSAVADDSKDTS